MAEILLLNQETIDKIAAGEVIERPSSVVKELVENAIDAGASAITVEIKEGGTSFIRITDNGCGMEREQVPMAFLRHSTSKIRSVEDLMTVHSLGFRGEALSSIAAVARVELITKTMDQLTGTRYVIEGSKELAYEEIGAPDGTTFLVKDLFYNTPARRKFLKTPHTEGGYVGDLVEKLALSHPDISFKYINNNQTKLHTSGDGNCKNLIYHVFGRDITAALLPVEYQGKYFSVSGFIGKPVITRGNRNYENYFINQRYIKSTLIARSIEDAYKKFIMQHQYPFTVLYFTFRGEHLDVNVHPTKMELRFDHNQEVYQELQEALYKVLSNQELIPQVPVTEEKQKKQERIYKEQIPEPFEKRRLNDLRKAVAKDSPYSIQYPQRTNITNNNTAKTNLPEQRTGNYHKLGMGVMEDTLAYRAERKAADSNGTSSETDMEISGRGQNLTEITSRYAEKLAEASPGTGIAERIANRIEDIRTNLIEEKMQCAGVQENPDLPDKPHSENAPKTNELQENHPGKSASLENQQYEEITLASYSKEFLTEEARSNHRIIGQLFETYWLIEYEDKLYIVDQHAAHEKVLYEKTMAKLKEKEFTSQMISPPILLSLDNQEIEMLEKYRTPIEQLGYVVEHFGGKEYTISGIPDNLYHLDMKDLFIEMLDDFSGLSGKEAPQLILEKVASMSCKAAVKGNNKLSLPEIEQLITDLLSLENPYNCPHGRPTIISMSKYEIEKKFKRII